MYPIRATRLMVTTDVHVSQASNSVVVEALDHLRRVEAEELVIVPGAAVRVHEEDDIGKLVVVVNYVGEVDLERKN
jgi:nitrate reductase NapAB chaperone NapD